MQELVVHIVVLVNWTLVTSRTFQPGYKWVMEIGYGRFSNWCFSHWQTLQNGYLVGMRINTMQVGPSINGASILSTWARGNIPSTLANFLFYISYKVPSIILQIIVKITKSYIMAFVSLFCWWRCRGELTFHWLAGTPKSNKTIEWWPCAGA